jgi:hypothetical protein
MRLALIALALAAGCGGTSSMQSATNAASSSVDAMAAATSAQRYHEAHLGWTTKHIERVFGTDHHPSAVLWDENAAKCWDYTFDYLPKPYTFCFGADDRLTMKATGLG